MPAKDKIAEEILDYLRKHPEACDTLEGITEWWLLEQRIKYELKRIEAAISNLVKQGWVLEIKRKNSRPHYCLNPEKTHED
jgi:hypothetical protein